jgi:ABC-type lipoprotein export system ATPase subunit
MPPEDYSKVRIETKDLILKKAQLEDWKDLYYNIWRHEESAKYMLWKPIKSEDAARSRMVKTIDYEKQEKYALIVYERQRLALARAFIRNVSFVIIDEGTSALDMKNATEIENTLMAEPDTGMIIISHNLSEETKEKLDNVISF